MWVADAKRNTYASEGDEASVTPSLNGAKQLEYRDGDDFCRDLSFGFARFAGKEIVEFRGRPVWSMVYSSAVVTSGDAPSRDLAPPPTRPGGAGPGVGAYDVS